MTDVNTLIAKLAEAGVVTIQDKEPLFTKAFANYVSFAAAKMPESEQSVQALQDLAAGFHTSLAHLSLDELFATLALVSYFLAVKEVPMQDVAP